MGEPSLGTWRSEGCTFVLAALARVTPGEFLGSRLQVCHETGDHKYETEWRVTLCYQANDLRCRARCYPYSDEEDGNRGTLAAMSEIPLYRLALNFHPAPAVKSLWVEKYEEASTWMENQQENRIPYTGHRAKIAGNWIQVTRDMFSILRSISQWLVSIHLY